MSHLAQASSQSDPQDQYGADYYQSHCGDVPYTADSPHWNHFYGRVADEIVRSLRPQRVFDAGCAIGLLVAALWDRNVETRGRDISAFAISQTRRDLREYCSVGSIADPIEGDFDLVLCIEVLEHMAEGEAIAAVQALTRAAPRILFSSTPLDFDEATHRNVRPTMYWLRVFAGAGFAPVPEYDATYVCPHAMLLERMDDPPTDRSLLAFAEIVRQRLARAAEATAAAEAARGLQELTRQLAVARDVLVAEREAFGDSEAASRARLEKVDATFRARLTETEAVWRERLEKADYRARLAARARYALRRLPRVAYWTVTLQLGTRVRQRRQWTRAQQVRAAGASAPGEADAATTAPPFQDAPADAAIAPSAADPAAASAAMEPPSVAEALALRWPGCDPLRTYPTREGVRRLSIITDSIGEGSLYGGVGTALVLGTLLARRMDARLRLITRTQPADVHRVTQVLTAQGLGWEEEIETTFAPYFASEEVAIGQGDVFLTTSWWTTRATLDSVPPHRMIYLLQEDERMFYPRGDDLRRCEETLLRDDVRCIVNSELLFRHLTTGPEAVPGLIGRSTWFDPAFPDTCFYDDLMRGDRHSPRNFLFYARPNNVRNLYWLGLEAISRAVSDGVLDPTLFHFIFVGSDLQQLQLPGGVTPELLENLTWDRYAELIRSVDVGLSLIDTPHPSYPPLDLAASGAVVVTNRRGIKQSLSSWSENIIAVAPSVPELCEGLRKAVAISADESTRRRNYLASSIRRDWPTALQGAIEHCMAWVEG